MEGTDRERCEVAAEKLGSIFSDNAYGGDHRKLQVGKME